MLILLVVAGSSAVEGPPWAAVDAQASTAEGLQLCLCGGP